MARRHPALAGFATAWGAAAPVLHRIPLLEVV
jgi:hypothetical protein